MVHKYVRRSQEIVGQIKDKIREFKIKFLELERRCKEVQEELSKQDFEASRLETDLHNWRNAVETYARDEFAQLVEEVDGYAQVLESASQKSAATDRGAIANNKNIVSELGKKIEELVQKGEERDINKAREEIKTIIQKMAQAEEHMQKIIGARGIVFEPKMLKLQRLSEELRKMRDELRNLV